MTKQGREAPRSIVGVLDAADVTPLEREVIRRLRTHGGYWEGDANALKILREYARVIQIQEHQP